MKVLRRILWSTAALLAVLLLACAWVLNTQAGARFAVDVATHFLDGKLSTGAVTGTVARGLHVTNLRWLDAEAGIDVRAGETHVKFSPTALLGGTLRVNGLTLQDVLVALTTVEKDESTQTTSLEPPLDIIVEDFTLERGEVRRDGATTLVITRAALAGEWTKSAIALEQARVVAPQGEISLEARLGLHAPWLEHATGTFDWRSNERRWTGTLATVREAEGIALRGTLESPFPLKLAGTMSDDRGRPWRLQLTAPRFDPRNGLLPGGELQALAAELEAHGDADTVNVAGNIDVNDERVSIHELAMKFSAEEILVSALRVGIAKAPGELRGNARVRLGQPGLSLFAHLHWDTLDLPASWVGEPLATSGQVFIDGNLEHFDSHGSVEIARSSLHSSIAWKANGSSRKIYLREGRISQANGELNVVGELGLASPVNWRLAATARGFDPAGLAPSWPGAIDFRIDTHGELADRGPSAQFELRELHGRLRGRPISGGGTLSLAPEMRLSGQLGLVSGAASLDISGTHGDRAQLDAKLEIESLADWNSALRGRAQVTLKATGRWPDTAFDAAANAQGLGFAGNSIDNATVELELRTPRTPSIELTAKARGAALSGMSFETISIAGSGTEASHQLSVDADGHPLDLGVKLHGAYSARRWSGMLDALKFDLEEVPSLALESPAKILVAADVFELGQACLSGGDIRLCLAGSGGVDGHFAASYSLRALPLDLLARLDQPNHGLAIAGHIDGEGNVRRERDGSIAGSATLDSASGSLEQSGQGSQLRLEYKALDLDATFAGNTASARVSATLTPDGSIVGDASIANLLGEDPTLQGNLKVALHDLSLLELMLPQLAGVAGTGELAATLGGSVSKPEIAAQLAVRDFQSDVPALGIHLEKGEFTARLTDDGSIDTRAKVTSGEGTLELSGQSASLQELDLAINGKNFLAANFPAAHLILDPELTITGSPSNFALGGSITIPNANIDLNKITNQGGAQISPDVVIVDRPDRRSRERLAMNTDVRVILGRNVKLTGFGLDATVGGQLRVVERPGSPSTGSGEIRLDGTYEAFGRQLAIERGQMLFANSPLDNPQLDVLATRKMPDITAKLRVTGSARRPQLDVFTDPATSPTEAMSYLITGKSMSDLRGSEGKSVDAAAQSLGGVLGNRLTRGVAGRFGIDSVGVEQSDELGSSAFTVGKYLSPGFFVSYGVGLFEPGTVITMRYAISEHWSLEAIDTPNDQRGGINFRIER